MKKIFILLAVIFSAAIANCVGKTYYLGIGGSIDAEGTKENPLSFDYLAQSIDHSGDLFLIGEGEYSNITIRIYGSINYPVVIRSEHWGKADIIGLKAKATSPVVHILGHYVHFQGFEIYTKDLNRDFRGTAIDKFSYGVAFGSSSGNQINSVEGVKVINNIIHDVGVGIYTGKLQSGGEIYGNLIYNIGWDEDDRGHGHHIYAQSKEGFNEYKYIKNNIIWAGAAEGIQCYTQKGKIHDLWVEGNCIFNLIGLNHKEAPDRAFMLGGYSALANLAVIGNITYQEQFQVGYESSWAIESNNVIFDGNIILGNWPNFYNINFNSFSGNQIETSRRIFRYRQPGDLWDIPVKNNDIVYVGTGALEIAYGTAGVGGTKTVLWNGPENKWRGDNEVTFLRKQIVRTKINEYDPSLMFVYIYNPVLENAINIDISDFVEDDDYQVFDVQNPFVPIENLSDEPFSFPMNLNEIAIASGEITKHHTKHTDSRFNVFIVHKSGGDDIIPPVIVPPIDPPTVPPIVDNGPKIDSLSIQVEENKKLLEDQSIMLESIMKELQKDFKVTREE